MRKHLLMLVTVLLLTGTLLMNQQIKYYGLISLFLILPYFVHTVNIELRRKLAVKDTFLGREAKRQLAVFSSKGYKMLIILPTVLLGVGLFSVYLVFMFYAKQAIKLQDIVLFCVSGLVLIGYLLRFYFVINNN